MPWRKILACVSGQLDAALQRKLEFVLEENRVYRALLERHSPHWRLRDSERVALVQKGKPLGKLLSEVITQVQPETLLKWHRRLVAKKWDYSWRQTKLGRPLLSTEIEQLIVQFARENPSWGYDRLAGALANLGHTVSDQTVGHVLQRHNLGPSRERRRHLTWAEFIRRHKEVLWATDFFTTEVWTRAGLTTFFVLFFIQLHTRKIVLGGVTRAPTEAWMKQVARNVTGEAGAIALVKKGYLLRDRDAKYSAAFDAIFQASGLEPLKLPPQSPNLNAFAQRWVRSVKDQCLDQMILLGQRALEHLLQQYVAHHHTERNHRGLDHLIPFPENRAGPGTGTIVKSERWVGCSSSTIAASSLSVDDA